jgi:cobalt-zinc-cadmium efflux system membrane fusion protein
MKLKGNIRSQAPLVFVALSLALLWATGSLHFGPAPEPHVEAEAATGHEGHDHAPGDSHEPGDWCAEHGVPESACTKCDPSIAAAFKARGDWCPEHDLPESVCPACNIAVPHEGADGALQALASVECEHGAPAVDCDDCRFEIGVVKVERSIADSLITTGTVEEREAHRTLTLTGEVGLARTRVVDVSTTAGGRVLEVNVDLGEHVETGDLLAVVHSGELGQAKAAYLKALTDCEIAGKEQERQAAMTEALGKLVVKLGDGAAPEEAPRTPDALIDLPPGLVGEWKSKLVGAATKLRLARLIHEREKALEERGISARAEHESAHQELEVAEAEYAALLEEVKLSSQLEKLKADNAERQACAAMIAAEQRLMVLGVDRETLGKLGEREPDAEFARLEIRAPRAGTVSALELSPGRYVSADESLFTIADLSRLWVWCDLYERDLALVAREVSEGRSLDVELRVAPFPGEVFPGRLDLLGSEVDEHTRTIKVRIQVDNPAGMLRPGMYADVALRVPTGGRALMVPRTAVLSDEGETFVFQYWRDDLWVRRDVTVLDSWGDFVGIEGAVPQGARVAASGGFMLKSDVLRGKMGAG